MKFLLCLTFFASLLAASAQNQPGANTPSAETIAAFTPLVLELVKVKTPAQWVETIQKASPTAWQNIQKRAAEPQSKGFALADFQALPEKEQKALLAALTPIITQAIGNMTPQEQVNLLTSAQKIEPNQLIPPIFNQALGLPK